MILSHVGPVPLLRGIEWLNSCSAVHTVLRMYMRQCALMVFAVIVSQPLQGGFLIGVKTGTLKVDVPSSSEPLNLAVNLGYELDTHLADLSLIGEINRTVSSGVSLLGDDLEFESEGIYLVYKSTWPLFVTLRGGMVKNEIIAGSLSSKGDGLSLGGGIGIVAGKALLQIEYTWIAGDANFFSFGLQF